MRLFIKNFLAFTMVVISYGCISLPDEVASELRAPSSEQINNYAAIVNSKPKISQ